MKKTLLLATVVALGGLGFAVSASAQDATCDNVVWSDSALEANPNIGDFCLEIVDKGGMQAARMHARVVRQSVNSTVVQWQRPDGSWSPSERRYPDRGFEAQIAGEDVRISDLAPRQEVNVYVPAGDAWSWPVAAAAATAAPMAAAEPEPMAEPEPEPMPAALPTTATQLPLFALLGGVLILLGGAISFVRSRI
ncbi:MAG: hypothetical protein PVG42_09230 [Lysobacterales bacterium]|jgi:hypothetical protein